MNVPRTPTAPVELQGRVLLSNGEEHDCVLRCEDVETIAIASSARIGTGEHVVCHVPGLGVVEGDATDLVAGGRRVLVRTGPIHRARLDARIAWHRRIASGAGDRRDHGRVTPVRPEVRVTAGAGPVFDATVIDLSATGAALRLPARPAVGESLVVGKRRATVVRHLDDGVAVRFALPLRAQDVTPETVL